MPLHLLAAALILSASVLGLGACSTNPMVSAEPIAGLLHDEAFAPPGQPVRTADIFALSPAMERYLDEDIAPLLRRNGRLRGLLEALYNRQQLRLDYDAATTRNAAEAFEARSGNCLSLVIMTAAFAQRLDLPVTFQTVDVSDSWSRGSGLLLAAGHVNLVLGVRMIERVAGIGTNASTTVDFLAPQDLRDRRVSAISESRIVAMYLNNRAAETLAGGDLDQAYAWSKAAVTADPDFQSAKITLGVVYHRRGLLAQAEAVFRHALRAEPTNTQALADLAAVLAAQGRTEAAQAVRRELARLETYPPFHFFELGRAAVLASDFEAGRAWLQRELRRDPDYHETHFWLGLAYVGLGNVKAAGRHLDIALANSTTRGDRDLYAAKLDRLQHRPAH